MADDNAWQKQDVKIKHISVVTKDKTKTEASRREYTTLLPEIKEILLKIKAYKKAFGKEYQNNDYVIIWPDGRLYQPNYITKEFQNVLQKAIFLRCVSMI